ncbi:hypothetical protein BUE93_21485 [Chromobacterium amazonense]|uniref:Uncharacterized protein n=1 Tax=Chromobacterium amazonense TaxID=1382803 RepID=A0A2S9WYR9_9NEIS|nr:hypothetical protein [Chromobacterium amazonense]PRP68615.1 hypothetical protein BUE93_21485 [Chromobacterium amazonense]
MAADNQFRLKITAEDQASPIVQKLEARLGKFATRLALGKKVDDLSKSQLQQRVTQRFDGLAQKIQSVGSALGNAASGLSAPVSAIAGGSLAAGVAASATSWASYGNSVLRASQVTGVGTDELQRLRGAAKLAGVEAEQLDSGVASLGTTLNDAVNGRNMAALAMLNRLGISIRYTRDGAIDTSAALKDLAQVMSSSKMSPQTKSMIAGQFGVQGLMPMLMDGRKKLESDMAQTQAMGAVQPLDKLKEADGAKRSEREASLAGQGAGNKLGNYTGPIYGKIMENAAKMLSEHPGSALAGGVAAGMGGAWVVKKTLSSIGTRMIESVVENVGAAAAKNAGKAGAEIAQAAAKGVSNAAAGQAAGAASEAAAKAGLERISSATLPFFGKLASRLSVGLGLLMDSAELNQGENEFVAAQQKRNGTASSSWHGLDMNGQAFSDLKDKAKSAYQPWYEFGDENTLQYMERYVKEHPQAKPAGWTDAAQAAPTARQKLTQAAQQYLPQKAQMAKALDSPLQPRGIRNNNPGNLQYVGQAGAVKEGGAGGRFAVFATPQAGLDAMAQQLKRYANSGLTSISDIANKWAPASENNTAAYVAAVAKRMGVDGKQSLDLSRAEVLRSLMDAMIVQENGRNPYARQMLSASASAAASYTGKSQAASADASVAPPVQAAPRQSALATLDPSQKMLLEQLKSLQDAVSKLADQKIHIAVSGLPAGARATATGGPATVASASKYNYSMPEMIAP